MTRLALLLLAASGLAILAEATVYWGASAELFNRMLVVAVAIWLMIRARKQFIGGATRSARTGGAVLLAVGLTAAPLAWFLVVQVGPRPVLLWWLATAWLLSASGTLLAESGRLGLKTLAFPVLFLLFVLPLPQRVEQPIQALLQEMTTSLSAWLLSLLGYVVQRDGFVLRLPHGDLEVLEACSGIHSAMALTAVALLLAHLRGLGLVRGAALFAMSLPVIVAANIFRVTASGVLQENVGINAIRGAPHELLGFASFLVGLAILAALSRFFRPSAPLVQGVVVPPRRSSRLAGGMLALSLVVSMAAALLGLDSVERLQQSAPLEQIGMSLGNWHGEKIPVPVEIREMLAFDRASHRVYHDSIGQELHTWVIYWSGAGSVRGYHHPDVCWPNHGWSLLDKRVEQLDSGVPLSVRRYALGGRRQMVCYWTQEGRRFWGDADEESAQLEGTPGHRWIGERLFGGPVQHSSRLAVLIAADLWGSGGFAEKSLLEFCRQFAVELYRVLPWAAPPAIRSVEHEKSD